MRNLVLLVVVLLTGCAESVGPDAGAGPVPDVTPVPADTAPPEVTPEAPAAPAFPEAQGPWVGELAAPTDGTFSFASPAPGELWLVTRSAGPGDVLTVHRRVGGHWSRVVEQRSDAGLVGAWVASPSEVWMLETDGTLHIWTPGGTRTVDLTRPGRTFTAVGDGWLAFSDPDPATGMERVGLGRWDGTALHEVSGPRPHFVVTELEGSLAVTDRGELLQLRADGWSLEHVANMTSSGASFRHFGELSTTADGETFLVGSLDAFRKAESGWTEERPGGVRPLSIWAQPGSATWAVNWLGELQERVDGAWQLRVRTTPAQVVGSDGTDVFVAGRAGVFRLVR